MKYLFSILFLFAALVASSQTEGLSGTVVDESGKLVNNVNVLLLKSTDSSLVKGVVTENGHYEIKKIVHGTYILLLSKIGYQKQYSTIIQIAEINAPMQENRFVLLAEAKNLQEVVITPQKPFIEQRLDKMIVNIENSIVNAGNNGLEILEKLPGLTIQADGVIVFKGRAGVQVQIDGRPTNMSSEDLASFLRSLMAHQIERIEIISNPSSRYDAAGSSGIINIRMKRDQKTGFNGTLTLGYNQGVYSSFNEGLAMNYRSKKINIYGNVNAGQRRSFSLGNSDRRFRDGSLLVADFAQDGKTNSRTMNRSFRAGADFFATKKSTLGLLITGLENDVNETSNSRTLISNQPGVTDSVLHVFSNTPSNWLSFTVAANFRHHFDSTGKELTVDFERASFDKSYTHFFQTVALYPTGLPIRTADTLTGSLPTGLITITSFKADYVHPLRKGQKIEGGAKLSQTVNNNNLLFYNQNGNGEMLNTTLSNHFIYTEKINAAYVSYSKELERWSFQAGIRGEQTIAQGEQLTTRDKFTRKYFQLFPTAFVNYTISEKHQLGFSYSKRVGRPAYNIVNPFRIFRDPFNYSEGNPFIRPQTSNNIEVNYIFNNVLIIGASYTRTNNSMTFVVKQNDVTKTTVETYDNLAKSEFVSVTASLNIKIAPWWTANNFAAVFYNHFMGSYNNQLVDNSGLIFNASINHSIQLDKNYTFEFGGFYLSKQPQGIISISPQGNVFAGIQRTFLQKRGTIRLNVTDIFKTQQWEKTTVFANIDARFKTSWDSRQVRLTLSWKFGKQTVPAEKRRKSSSEEEKGRVAF